jgi:poly-beta-1,6-N-acetyl-D-glucosamine biosynthesis protein PgaD
MQLIYNTPLSFKHPARWGWSSVTLALWLGWVVLWSPFLTLAAWLLGFGVIGGYLPLQLFLILLEVETNLNILMTGASTIVIVVSAWSWSHYMLFRSRTRAVSYLPTRPEDLAARAALLTEDIVAWQGAARLLVHHDATGRPRDAHVFPVRRVPPLERPRLSM